MKLLPKRRALLFACFGNLGAFGCAHQHLEPAALKALDAQAMIARVRLAKSTATELTADAQVTYFGSKGRLRLMASLMLARPDKFRANLLSPQGGALYAIGSDGSEVTVLDFLAQRGTRVSTQTASLGKLIGISELGMTPEGLVSLVLGEAPLLPESVCKSAWDGAHGQVMLRCQDRTEGTGSPVSPTSSTQLLVDPDTWQISDAVFFHEAHGTLTCHVRERGAARVATRTEFVWEPLAGPAERIELTLTDVDVAPNIAIQKFALEVPESIRLVESLTGH